MGSKKTSKWAAAGDLEAERRGFGESTQHIGGYTSTPKRDEDVPINEAFIRETIDDDGLSNARKPLLEPDHCDTPPNPWATRIIIALWICMAPLIFIYRKEITNFIRKVAIKGAEQGNLLYLYYFIFFVTTVPICMSVEILFVSGGFIFTHLHGQFAGFAIAVVLGFVAFFTTMVICFLISRHLLKSFLFRYLRNYKYYGALIRATEQEGLAIVAMIRLSPFFPPTIVSYIFGSTNVPISDYCIASFASLPAITFFSYLGSLIQDLSDDSAPQRSWAQMAPFIGTSVVITVIGLYYTFIVTKRHLEPNRTPRSACDPEIAVA